LPGGSRPSSWRTPRSVAATS